MMIAHQLMTTLSGWLEPDNSTANCNMQFNQSASLKDIVEQWTQPLSTLPTPSAVAAPCSIFMVLSIPYLLMQAKTKDKTKPLKRSMLSLLKMVLSLVLAGLAYLETRGHHQVTNSYFSLTTAYGFRAATMMTTAILQEVTRRKGLNSGPLLNIFWLLSAVGSLSAYWNHAMEEGFNWMTLGTTTTDAHTALVLLQLLCSFLSESADSAEEDQDQETKTKKPVENEEAKAGFLSKITFGWHTRFLMKGYKNPIKKEDLYPLTDDLKSPASVSRFEHYWNDEIEKSLRSRSELKSSGPEVDSKNIEEKVYKPKLVRTVFKAFGLQWGVACFIGVVEDSVEFLKPIILSQLIAFINTPNASTLRGFGLALVMYLAISTKCLLCQQFIHHLCKTGMNIKAAVVSSIYKKALRLSNGARQKANVGEVVNLMSVDAGRLEGNTHFLTMIWSVPIQVLVPLYLLWTMLGASVLAGLAIMILLIPINGSMAKKVRDLHETESKHKDKRVKLMNEILNGIRVLKLYAWEKSFHEKVLGIRNEELGLRQTRAKIDACSSVFWHCSSTMVSLATFSVYILSSVDNTLDAQKIFVSMSLFHMLQHPIGRMPHLVASLSMLSMSITRLEDFFANEELNETNVQHTTSGQNALDIVEGTFSWESTAETPTLKDINIKIKEGSLVAIVGAVGSGKSSLLSAMLGETNKMAGTVKAKGSIAYVPQQAWIQNATLRENILFYKGHDTEKYNEVVNACALATDFEILTAGDSTEIGEKGINLSGGQKQRVNLARAVYSDKDTYLLDDPLSAVDAHVGKHIFNEVIGHDGLLKNKTRVLVTHGVWCLPYVDQVLVIKNNTISEMGTYNELLQNQGAFSEFMANYAGVKPEDLESDSNSDSDSEKDSKAKNKKDSAKTDKESKDKTKADSKDGKLIDDEEDNKDEGGLSVANIMVYLRAYGLWTAFMMIILQVSEKLTDMACDLWLSDWSNHASDDEDLSRYQRLAVYAVIGLVQAIVVSGATVVMAIGSQRASGKIHSDLLMRVLRAPMSFFDTTPVGRVVNRFAKDVSAVDNDIPGCSRAVICAMCNFVSRITIISYSSPYILFCMAPIAVLYLFVVRLYTATSKQTERLQTSSNSPIFSHFSETLHGAQTIRAYDQVDRFIEESQKNVDFHHQCKYNCWTSHRWLSIRLEGMGNVLVLCTAMFTVLAHGTLTPSFAALAITYALDLTGCLNWFVFVIAHLGNHIVSIERVKEYTEMPTEAPWVVEDKRPSAEWPATGVVAFENYSTRYREGLDLVLRGISAEVTDGQRIGMVGRTGAGKSSLTMALFRMIEPAGGRITIDGVDTREIGLHDLRSKITIIPQDPVLFSGSLKMNLDPFDAHTNEELWAALEHSHLKSFVEGLAAGLDHEVSEGGENLSVGQRQLVCLARALLKKTKVLVMDEATAAVDLETDELIQKTIRTKFSDCTVFTIAHRLNTIIDYTKIMVFDKGHIVEYAPPDELLADKSSIFHSMAKDSGLVE